MPEAVSIGIRMQYNFYAILSLKIHIINDKIVCITILEVQYASKFI